MPVVHVAHRVADQEAHQAQGDGDTVDSAWGTAVTATDTGTAGTRRFIAFSGLAVAGTPAQRDKLGIRLSRKAADSGDTLDVDAHFIEMQLNITIAAIGYYYLTNRFTGSFLFEQDFMAPEALDARLAFNLDTVMRLVDAD